MALDAVGVLVTDDHIGTEGRQALTEAVGELIIVSAGGRARESAS